AGEESSKINLLTLDPSFAFGEFRMTKRIFHHSHMDKILSFGVMMTPALVVDGDVKSSGKVLTSVEIKIMLTSDQGAI
ncbi:thioredoxin family protein, partial [bacterium]|nr:thioredoxin family protein [bacterium]